MVSSCQLMSVGGRRLVSVRGHQLGGGGGDILGQHKTCYLRDTLGSCQGAWPGGLGAVLGYGQRGKLGVAGVGLGVEVTVEGFSTVYLVPRIEIWGEAMVGPCHVQT